MKKVILALAVMMSTLVVVGCDDKESEQSQSKSEPEFVGHWKAVAKANGEALHPKLSSTLDITCSSATCHVINKKKTMLSDDEMVSNTDWNIKDNSTLMKANGLSSIYVQDGKIVANELVYERQKE